MLPKRRSGQCSRVAGGQEGGLSSGRIDPTASRPTPFHPAPPPRRAPPTGPMVCPGFGFERFAVNPRFISGTRSALSSLMLTSGPTPFCPCKPFSYKACPGKSLQKQARVGPLVGSQKRRALAVPLINRLYSACQLLILFLHSVYIRLQLFVLLERRLEDVYSMPSGER